MVRKSILLAEDDRNDELLTLRALRKGIDPADVAVVRDGAAVLDYLFAAGEYTERDASDLPRVLLLDLKMPKLNGHEVIERLRADKRTRDLPIVVLTSSDLDRDMAQSYRLGANSYVQKPVDSEKFRQAVEQLASYWLRVNRIPRQSLSQV